MAAKKKSSGRKAAAKSTRDGKVKLFASPSMLTAARPDQPVITRGEHRQEKHYFAERDGSINVPASEVDDFLAMGCSRTPQEPVAVSNVALGSRSSG